jgi:hypothetical protein
VSTNQTFLTIGALAIFSLILVSFYRILAQSSVGVNDAQAGVSALTLATTYTEYAQGLSFDEATIDSFITPSELNSLTAPDKLGPDNPPKTGEPSENSLKAFDDVDDLKNFEVVDSTLKGVIGTYKTRFDVNYVNPLNVDQISASRTFAKRLDLKVWRIYPPSTDTLKSSIVMGYFHFD